MDLVLILKELWRKKWVIIVPAIITGVIVFILTNQKGKEYKSTAQLATGYTVNEPVSLLEEKFDVHSTNTKFTNLMESMNSKLVISLLSYKLLLNELSGNRFLDQTDFKEYGLSKGDLEKTLKEKVEKFEALSPSNPEEAKIYKLMKDKKIAPEDLRKNLSVKRLDASDYISIEYTSPHPQMSAFAVNSFTNEFLRYHNSLTTARTTANIDFFSNLVDEAKSTLDEKSQKLKDYKTEQNLLNFDNESQASIEQLQQYEDNREEEVKKIRGLTHALDRVNRNIRSLDQSGTSVQSRNERILQLRKKIADLNEKYSSTGSPETKKKINELRAELEVELLNTPMGRGNDLETLERQRDQYEYDLAMAKGRLESTNESIAKLREKLDVADYNSVQDTLKSLERDVNIASEEYLLALDKFNKAKKADLVGESSIRPVYYGQPALEPEPDKSLLLTLAGTAGTFSMICAVIFLAMYFDSSIKTPSALKEHSKLPLLGYVYRNNKKTANNLINGSKSHSNKELQILNQIKDIRFQLNSEKYRSLLFTSNDIIKEKPSFLYLLAKSFVNINKRVLLIDLNFKEATLTHLIYNEEPLLVVNDYMDIVKKEKVAVMEGGAQGNHQTHDSASDIFSSGLVQGTDYDNMHIIPCRKDERSPAEIFSYFKLKEMISQGVSSYDKVIIDGAPLHKFPDTKEIMSLSDRVVLVFSATNTYSEASAMSVDLTKRSGDASAVLLNVNPDHYA